MAVHDSTGVSGVVTISVSGRFDYFQHVAFRAAHRPRHPGPKGYVIDLDGVSYMDSSALGMLLVLRDQAGEGVSITLARPRPAVRKLLEIANFQKLFRIE